VRGLRIATRFAELVAQGPALDSIMGLLTNATGGGGWDALTPGSGDSLSLKSFQAGSRAHLIMVHAGNSTTKCDFSIRSPRMHDSTRGLRLAYEFNPTASGADGNPQIIFPRGLKQEMYSTDTLVIETLATANDDVNVILSIYYEQLGGIDGRLITPAEVKSRTKNLFGNRVSPTAGATNLYGTAEAINADDDRFIADTDYALVGFLTDLPFTSLGIKGIDTGNVRVAAPGHWDPAITSGYFLDLSDALGIPLVPVINSNNKGVTFVDAVDCVSGIAPLVTLLWAELV
jgi:hypothetical protein